MKRIKLIFTLMLASVCLLGCAQALCFTDACGQSIQIDRKPQRTAVLFSSLAEIWQLAGGEVQITVGESIERGFAPEGTLLVDGGAGKRINLELLLAAEADFVIGSADIPAHVEAAELLRAANIPFALFRVDNFEDYLSVLQICTQITGRNDAFPATEVPSRMKFLQFFRNKLKLRMHRAYSSCARVVAASTPKPSRQRIISPAPCWRNWAA